MAGDGGCIAWPLNISLCKAKEYLLTGNIIKAPEAERIGLINKALPADKLMEEAWKFAKQLTEGAMWAMSWTKTCLNKIVEHRIDLLYDAMIAYEFHSIGPCPITRKVRRPFWRRGLPNSKENQFHR